MSRMGAHNRRRRKVDVGIWTCVSVDDEPPSNVVAVMLTAMG